MSIHDMPLSVGFHTTRHGENMFFFRADYTMAVELLPGFETSMFSSSLQGIVVSDTSL